VNICLCRECHAEFIKPPGRHESLFCSKECKKIRRTKSNLVAVRYTSAKWRAEKYGYEFTITKDYLRSILTDHCAVTGFPFNYVKTGEYVAPAMFNG